VENWSFLVKLNIHLPCNSAIFLFTQENKNICPQKDMCKKVTVALFLIAIKWVTNPNIHQNNEPCGSAILWDTA
jgi:hypothetical protein